jgi:acyl CoA:acetate/3-ketoacid CoA transferase beta subunit
MDDDGIQDLYVAGLAREMRDGERVFIGTNQNDVALAAYLARRLWAPRLRFWANGMPLVDPSQDLLRVGRSTYDSVLVQGRDSTFRQAHAFDDGLRAPVVFAGGLQVDGRGNANLAGVRGDDGWRLRGPGSAGLPSLTTMAERFFIAVPVHEPRTLVERCSAISVLGDPRARRDAGLHPQALVAVITPLARFVPSDEGLVLTEVAPGHAPEDVERRTGFPVRRADELAVRAALTADEAAALAVLRAAAQRNGRAGRAV